MPPIDPSVWAGLEALEAAGEPGFLPSLIREFLGSAPERIQALREACGSGDAAAVERGAHTFKGSCGMLGAAAMARRCEELEALGRGGSADGLAVVEALDAEWRAVREALESELSKGA